MRRLISPQPPERMSKWAPYFLCGGVIGLWLFGWVIAGVQDNPSEFGDQFGGVNALFSGLAFAGVIYAILLQKEELVLQRFELQQTREVMGEQERQLERQASTMKDQAFEETFFHLVNLHADMVSRMRFGEPGTGNLATDRECLHVAYSHFRKCYRQAKEQYKGESEQNIIRMAFKEFWEAFEEHIGYYVRSLLTTSTLSWGKFRSPTIYSDTVNGQLSGYELALLFYYALSDIGDPQAPRDPRSTHKAIIQDLGLLEHVPANLILHEAHLGLFDKKAFGSSGGPSQPWKLPREQQI